MPVHSKLWYLQRFKLIDALEESQRRLLEETTRMQEVKRGERIYQPGDPSAHFFLVKRGVIKIAALGPSNREVLLSFRHPGDVFGELALLDEAPVTSSEGTRGLTHLRAESGRDSAARPGVPRCGATSADHDGAAR